MKNYIECALRTESPVTSELIERLVEFPREIHALAGILTECGEFTVNLEDLTSLDSGRHNALEEIGDLFWYCAILADCLRIKEIKPALQRSMLRAAKKAGAGGTKFAQQTFQEFIYAAGNMFDVYKKTIFYAKPLPGEDELRRLFWEMIVPLSHLCAWVGHPMEEVMEANIRKLQVRYPEKFTEGNAVERNVEAEIGALVPSSTPTETPKRTTTITITLEEKNRIEKEKKDAAVQSVKEKHVRATSTDLPAIPKPPLCGACHADALRPSPNNSGFWVCNQCGNLTAMP